MPQKNANPVCTVNLFWCAGLSWCILLRNPLSVNRISLCLRSVCCTRCMSSWPCSGVCLWVRMSKISRTRYSISQMGCMIVEKVRFRSLVGTCEGAFRLNQQFEIHTSQKSWNLLHILVELPWTIYLPLLLLLKMVMVKYTGVPCGISKCNLKHSTESVNL